MTEWDIVFTEQLEAALELAHDDPDFLRDRDGFLRVMWPDDDDPKRHGMTHDAYRELLLQVFSELRLRHGVPQPR